MADKFYGAIVGDQLTHQVTEAASTTSEAVELRISDSAYSNKPQVLAAVQAILHYLTTVETDPIA
jgi:hypothetical protein